MMKSVAGKAISSSSLLLRLLLMPSSSVTPLLSATLQSSCWKLLQAAVVQVSFPTRIDSSQIHNNPWRFLHLKDLTIDVERVFQTDLMEGNLLKAFALKNPTYCASSTAFLEPL
jgi:hypothetical protein